MEFSSDLNLAISTLLLLLLLLLLANYFTNRFTRNTTSNSKGPPEPPGALPIIGHLHFLTASSNRPLVRSLSDLCGNHGPIVSLRLGAYRTIVVRSRDAIKDCLTTHDKALASRPASNAGKHINYDYASIAMASYGPYLQTIKKLAVTKLLSPQKLKALKDVRVSEVDSLVSRLYLLCKANNANQVLIGELLEHLTSNVITRMVVGETYFGSERGERIGELMKEFMVLVGALLPSDLIPVLGWLDFLPRSPVRNMKRVAREFDAVMEGWIQRHKSRRLEEGDFMDELLSAFNDDDDDRDDSGFGHSNHTIVKANAMILIIAGADTPYVVLVWILSNLLNNKRILELAQQELDSKVGRDRWVDDSDIQNLVYLQAIVKETLRLYPPGPLAAPHEAVQDCHIAGYHVPKGTRVILNLWELHRDPEVWSDRPDEFVPERFLQDNGRHLDVLGSNFEFLPFGSGRRSCPGVHLGMQIMHLTMARLLQGFWISSPMNAHVDMKEGPGLSMPKMVPLEVDVKLRLHPQLYQDLIVA